MAKAISRPGPVHGEMPVTVRKVDQADTVEFIAATDVAVRDGSVLKQNWELRNFRKNPLFLWGHDYSGLPVGKVVSAKVQRGETGKQLVARVQFVPGELYPFAQQVREFYEAGYLHAVSVGFQPLERREMTEQERETHGTTNPWAEVFERSELLEISAVTVPMDANALKASIERGYVRDDSMVDRVAQSEADAYEVDQDLIMSALDAIRFEDEPAFGAGVDPAPPAPAFEARLARTATRIEQVAARLTQVSEHLVAIVEALSHVAAEEGSEEDEDEGTAEPESPLEKTAEPEVTEEDEPEETGAVEEALSDLAQVLADVGKE